MRLKKDAGNERLARLTELANERGVTLSYTHKLFFLRLLEYAERKGEHTPRGIVVYGSVRVLGELLDFKPRTAVQCVERLVACGVMRRVEDEPPMPRLPMITIIPKDICNFFGMDI